MCTHCNDTGSLSKALWGDLDCAHCGAATERAALNIWARRETPEVDLIDAWVLYQHGKAAAANQNQ
jgi:hypothetical protein